MFNLVSGRNSYFIHFHIGLLIIHAGFGGQTISPLPCIAVLLCGPLLCWFSTAWSVDRFHVDYPQQLSTTTRLRNFLLPAYFWHPICIFLPSCLLPGSEVWLQVGSDHWSGTSLPLQLIQHAGLQSLPLCLQMADRRSVHYSFLTSLLLLELTFA